MKNKIKLIVFDLDGTVLDDNKNIDSNLLSVLNDIKINYTIASGRCKELTEIILNKLNVNTYYIGDNGASVCLKDKTIQSFYIDSNLNNEIASILYTSDIPFIMYTDTHYHIRALDSKKFRENKVDSLTFYSLSMKKDFDIKEDFSKERCFKIQLDSTNREKLIKKVVEEIKQKYKNLEIIKSEDTVYCITSVGIDKYHGVEKIADLLNISTSEIMAFGDNYNDMMMLKNIGVGVAMKNAKQEVKEIAKYICGDNNHNGVSEFLKNYFNV